MPDKYYVVTVFVDIPPDELIGVATDLAVARRAILSHLHADATGPAITNDPDNYEALREFQADPTATELELEEGEVVYSITEAKPL